MGQLIVKFASRSNPSVETHRRFEIKFSLSDEEEKELVVQEVVVNGETFERKK